MPFFVWQLVEMLRVLFLRNTLAQGLQFALLSFLFFLFFLPFFAFLLLFLGFFFLFLFIVFCQSYGALFIVFNDASRLCRFGGVSAFFITLGIAFDPF